VPLLQQQDIMVWVSGQPQIQAMAFQMVADLLHLMAQDLMEMDLDQPQIQAMEFLTVLAGNLPDMTLNLY
jgi:hypothetical protein